MSRLNVCVPVSSAFLHVRHQGGRNGPTHHDGGAGEEVRPGEELLGAEPEAEGQ